jgi:hypothetical protein
MDTPMEGVEWAVTVSHYSLLDLFYCLLRRCDSPFLISEIFIYLFITILY